jgi:menaquinone-specific isochorismate synthase
MGLAGSIRRGKNPAEDEELADQLWHDPKERHEHALVVNEIQAKLTPLTRALDVPTDPQVLRLGYIQHLHTPIHGELQQASGVLPLVERLHPTPALGGSPRAAALEFIRRAEPVPRGWYAAPIGFIDAQLEGMFAVAIRSAIAQERRVWLYAGAGIVASSIPQKEWDEIGLKFKPMLNALGVEGQVKLHVRA